MNVVSPTLEGLDPEREYQGIKILAQCCKEVGITYGRNNIAQLFKDGILKARKSPRGWYLFTKDEIKNCLEIMRGMK